MVTQDENNIRLTALFTAGIQGDKQLYALFLTEASRYLRRFIARRVPAPEVEDVLQEILISVHKARNTYDGKRSILPWISAIARYRLLDYLRKTYARAASKHIDIDDVAQTLTADVTEPGVMSEYIMREVENLPERQQKILYLMHTEGFTAKEIGQKIGMKESAVKVAAHRAYKLIKSRLKSA